jgi:hypothetical protein
VVSASLDNPGFNGQCFILDALRLVVGSIDLVIKWQCHSDTPCARRPELNPAGSALMARHHQQNADQTMLQTVLAGLQLGAQRATGAPLLFSAVLPTCWN